jgi:large subunit ribosomal protein L4
MPTSKVKTTKAPVKKVTTKPVSTPKASGLSVPVFGLDGAKKGTVTLPKDAFGAKVNEKLIAQAVRVYLVNQRQGTQSTKTRGEVQGSTRKIYRQKGTGRARHGAITAPIFVGGGIAFGPRPRNFELKMPQQMKRKALASALFAKLSEDGVRVVDLAGLGNKTREIYKMLKTLEVVNKKGEGKVLFVTNESSARKAASNIEAVETLNAASINTYAAVSNKFVIISKDAVEALNRQFEQK